ncbi:MAG: hypothetical protein ACREP0_04480 [Rhodanobacteraceae bacterium]
MKDDPPESPPPEPRNRGGWLRREGIDLGDAVVQFFSVLLGVLLALLIGQWTNHRQQQAKAQATSRQQQATVNEAMHAIHVELATNRSAIQNNYTLAQTAARRMYDSPANRKQPPRPCLDWDGADFDQGIWLSTILTDAAYRTAIATQAIVHMPYQQAQTVAEVYGAQRELEATGSMLRGYLMSPNPNKLDVCIGWIESMAMSERMVSNSAYTLIIGPDKTKWPAPPFPLPGPPTK